MTSPLPAVDAVVDGIGEGVPEPVRRRSGGVILRDPADAAARVLIAGLFLGLAYRIGLNVLETGRLSGLLLLTSELLVVVLTIIRRPAVVVDRSLGIRVISVVSIIGPFLMYPDAGAALLGEPAALVLSGTGLLIVIAGKASLGRSFGLLPANRGVVCSGIYRWIRHPIYLGYVVSHGTFLLANATWWNIAALVTADIALLIRSHREERTLLADPAYQAYAHRVPWRFVPRLY